MHRLCWQFLVLFILTTGCTAAFAQAGGSFTLTARPKIGGKQQSLKHKRFYIFRGGREANKDLINELKAAKFPSRNCFYCQMKASAEFMTWLGANCESANCRQITSDDIKQVPEFQAAYQKGVASPQFKRKPALAETWLLTSFDPVFLRGLYDKRKEQVETILKKLPADKQPVQSSMTDLGVTPAANFLNVPLIEGNNKFLYVNLVPIEVADKSYIWACEVDIAAKLKKSPLPELPLDTNKVKNCEVMIWDLPACQAGMCDKQ